MSAVTEDPEGIMWLRPKGASTINTPEPRVKLPADGPAAHDAAG